ncbi:MAG: hypothetical protein ABSD42_07495 [Candidatus Bathyarchaeia archaeon]
MKFVQLITLISDDKFLSSPFWIRVISDLKKSIDSVKWPVGSTKFTLYDDKGRSRGEGNGVTPIKKMFQSSLKRQGWDLEERLPLATRKAPGKVDALLRIDGVLPFVVEWETGNISSSHRALNKMCIGLLDKKLSGGILVLPTRKMYNYLTDRVGNFAEIEPYLDLWKSLNIGNGFLGIITVEHDNVSRDVPRIPKGTDGRATA